MSIEIKGGITGLAIKSATLEDRTALASSLVVRLENLSTAPLQRHSDFVTARTCFAELRGVCAGSGPLRAYLERGREAMRAVALVRRSEVEATIARRAARTAEAARRAQALQRSEAYRRRVVRILETAAIAENPSRFAPQVRQCAILWREAGPCEQAQRALFEAYRAAQRDFWDAVRREHATARQLATEARSNVKTWRSRLAGRVAPSVFAR